MWTLYWLLLCIAIGLMSGTERSLFGVMGESLTFRVRKELIRGVIFKQLSWFDRESHAPGVLTNVFSEDVSSLNGMTTEVLCTVTEAILGLILAVLIAIVYSWQQALLTIVVLPILIVGVVAMSRLQWGNKGGKVEGTTLEVDMYEKANALLSDTILNYRTVVSFGEKNVA